MKSYTSIGDALGALRTLAFNPASSVPEDMKEHLLEVAKEISPVSAIVGCAELLFARRDELDAETLGLAAGLASFATENGWHGLASDDRGIGMVLSLRRTAGDKAPAGDWPEPKHDPMPIVRFTKGAAAFAADMADEIGLA